MKLIINGKEQEARSSRTIAELMQELEITAPNFAVALNGQVIPRSQHDSTEVREGDKIEIVHAVGGGV
ncbi:MAG: sulfur carrier protein ThiS [Nitrospinaceae bacterium]|nr:sulfur carrier protein ThiS [Nitrospinaceae bacterium]NIS87202.1 sulfur carrier protein ThiS [Nitrospinaceae bacterium]NIU98431.1 sulfur carrier protein ThiS [Nitrospinaceae bacterium]